MADDTSTASSQNYITEDTLVGVSYGLVATTSLFFLARIAVRIWRPKAIQAEDYILLLVFLMYLALIILYVVVTPVSWSLSTFFFARF
jgi:hypothetical protein